MVVLANKKKCNVKSTELLDESDDERDARHEAVLSHACGNLNEDLQDLESDHIIDLSSVRRKKRTNTARIYKNGKVPKKPKTLPKL